MDYQTDTLSFDIDDLDFIASNEYNLNPNSYDNLIAEDIFSLPEIDQEESINNSSQESDQGSLICGVCGAPAVGYNFDQITCESCKAFFRRNALRDMTQLRCRFSGSCPIDIRTRRYCAYCRLKKCFDIKMRKDWIRTDEEKELRQLQRLAKEQKKLNKLTDNQQASCDLPLVARKKKRLMIKPITQDFLVNPIYKLSSLGANRILSNNDRTLLNNITNAYQLGADKADFSHIIQYDQSTPFSQFLNDAAVMHGSLIWFYKSIGDFRELDLDDQVVLIKCNLVNIIHLHYIIVQNFQDNPLIGKHMPRWIDEDFHEKMSRTRRYFYRFMKYPLLLKLTLIVFIFSINLSTQRGSSQFIEYKSPRKLFDIQNFYLNLLWRYLRHLFDEKEAIQSLVLIVMQILQYQKLMVIMESHVRQEPQQNILHSLIQSIFGLT